MSLANGKLIRLSDNGDDIETIKVRYNKISIGSTLLCDVVLANAQNKIHCEINSDAFGRIYICNLEKCVFTVNGNEVKKKRQLADNSIIQIGANTFRWDCSSNPQTPAIGSAAAVKRQVSLSEPLQRAKKTALKKVRKLAKPGRFTINPLGRSACENVNVSAEEALLVNRTIDVQETIVGVAESAQAPVQNENTISNHKLPTTNAIVGCKNVNLHVSQIITTSYSPLVKKFETPKRGLVRSNINTPNSHYKTPMSALATTTAVALNDLSYNETAASKSHLQNSAVFSYLETPKSSVPLNEPTTPQRMHTPSVKQSVNTSLLKSAIKNRTLHTPRSTLKSAARFAQIVDATSPLSKNTSSPLVKRLSTNIATRFSMGNKELTPIRKLNLNSPSMLKRRSAATRISLSGCRSGAPPSSLATSFRVVTPQSIGKTPTKHSERLFTSFTSKSNTSNSTKPLSTTTKSHMNNTGEIARDSTNGLDNVRVPSIEQVDNDLDLESPIVDFGIAAMDNVEDDVPTLAVEMDLDLPILTETDGSDNEWAADRTFDKSEESLAPRESEAKMTEESVTEAAQDSEAEPAQDSEAEAAQDSEPEPCQDSDIESIDPVESDENEILGTDATVNLTYEKQNDSVVVVEADDDESIAAENILTFSVDDSIVEIDDSVEISGVQSLDDSTDGFESVTEGNEPKIKVESQSKNASVIEDVLNEEPKFDCVAATDSDRSTVNLTFNGLQNDLDDLHPVVFDSSLTALNSPVAVEAQSNILKTADGVINDSSVKNVTFDCTINEIKDLQTSDTSIKSTLPSVNISDGRKKSSDEMPAAALDSITISSQTIKQESDVAVHADCIVSDQPTNNESFEDANIVINDVRSPNASTFHSGPYAEESVSFVQQKSSVSQLSAEQQSDANCLATSATFDAATNEIKVSDPLDASTLPSNVYVEVKGSAERQKSPEIFSSDSFVSSTMSLNSPIDEQKADIANTDKSHVKNSNFVGATNELDQTTLSTTTTTTTKTVEDTNVSVEHDEPAINASPTHSVSIAHTSIANATPQADDDEHPEITQTLAVVDSAMPVTEPDTPAINTEMTTTQRIVARRLSTRRSSITSACMMCLPTVTPGKNARKFVDAQCDTNSLHTPVSRRDVGDSLVGVRELLKTPARRASTDLRGLTELMKTPASRATRNGEVVSGELPQTPMRRMSLDVRRINQSLSTPRPPAVVLDALAEENDSPVLEEAKSADKVRQMQAQLDTGATVSSERVLGEKAVEKLKNYAKPSIDTVPMNTEIPASPSSNLTGIRELLKTPARRMSVNLQGVSELMSTPTIHQTALVEEMESVKQEAPIVDTKVLILDPNIEAVKLNKENSTSPNSLPNLTGVRELLKTPARRLSVNLQGVSELMSTPSIHQTALVEEKESVKQETPIVDTKVLILDPNIEAVKLNKENSTSPCSLPNLTGVRELLKTPARRTSVNLQGVSELMSTPTIHQTALVEEMESVKQETPIVDTKVLILDPNIEVVKFNKEMSTSPNSLPNLTGVRELLKTPARRMSVNLQGVSELMSTPTIHQTALVEEMESVKQETPIVDTKVLILDPNIEAVKLNKENSTSPNSLPNLTGVRELLKTPTRRMSVNLQGVSELMSTPTIHQTALVEEIESVKQETPIVDTKVLILDPNIEAVKLNKEISTSPNSLPNLSGVRELLKTPARRTSVNLQDLSELMSTPTNQLEEEIESIKKETPQTIEAAEFDKEISTTPCSLPNLTGVRELLKTPARRTSVNLQGLSELMSTPTNHLEEEIESIKKETPQTIEAAELDKEISTSPSSLPNLTGVRELLKTPARRASVNLQGFSELMSTPTNQLEEEIESIKKETPQTIEAAEFKKEISTSPSSLPNLTGVRELLQTPVRRTSINLIGISELLSTPAVEEETESVDMKAKKNENVEDFSGVLLKSDTIFYDSDNSNEEPEEQNKTISDPESDRTLVKIALNDVVPATHINLPAVENITNRRSSNNMQEISELMATPTKRVASFADQTKMHTPDNKAVGAESVEIVSDEEIPATPIAILLPKGMRKTPNRRTSNNLQGVIEVMPTPEHAAIPDTSETINRPETPVVVIAQPFVNEIVKNKATQQQTENISESNNDIVPENLHRSVATIVAPTLPNCTIARERLPTLREEEPSSPLDKSAQEISFTGGNSSIVYYGKSSSKMKTATTEVLNRTPIIVKELSGGSSHNTSLALDSESDIDGEHMLMVKQPFMEAELLETPEESPAKLHTNIIIAASSTPCDSSRELKHTANLPDDTATITNSVVEATTPATRPRRAAKRLASVSTPVQECQKREQKLTTPAALSHTPAAESKATGARGQKVENTAHIKHMATDSPSSVKQEDTSANDENHESENAPSMDKQVTNTIDSQTHDDSVVIKTVSKRGRAVAKPAAVPMKRSRRLLSVTASVTLEPIAFDSTKPDNPMELESKEETENEPNAIDLQIHDTETTNKAVPKRGRADTKLVSGPTKRPRRALSVTTTTNVLPISAESLSNVQNEATTTNEETEKENKKEEKTQPPPTVDDANNEKTVDQKTSKSRNTKKTKAAETPVKRSNRLLSVAFEPNEKDNGAPEEVKPKKGRVATTGKHAVEVEPSASNLPKINDDADNNKPKKGQGDDSKPIGVHIKRSRRLLSHILPDCEFDDSLIAPDQLDDLMVTSKPRHKNVQNLKTATTELDKTPAKRSKRLQSESDMRAEIAVVAPGPSEKLNDVVKKIGRGRAAVVKTVLVVDQVSDTKDSTKPAIEAVVDTEVAAKQKPTAKRRGRKAAVEIADVHQETSEDEDDKPLRSKSIDSKEIKKPAITKSTKSRGRKAQVIKDDSSEPASIVESTEIPAEIKKSTTKRKAVVIVGDDLNSKTSKSSRTTGRRGGKADLLPDITTESNLEVNNDHSGPVSIVESPEKPVAVKKITSYPKAIDLDNTDETTRDDLSDIDLKLAKGSKTARGRRGKAAVKVDRSESSADVTTESSEVKKPIRGRRKVKDANEQLEPDLENHVVPTAIDLTTDDSQQIEVKKPVRGRKKLAVQAELPAAPESIVEPVVESAEIKPTNGRKLTKKTSEAEAPVAVPAKRGGGRKAATTIAAEKRSQTTVKADANESATTEKAETVATSEISGRPLRSRPKRK